MTELVVAGMLMFSQRDSNMPEALGAMDVNPPPPQTCVLYLQTLQ